MYPHVVLVVCDAGEGASAARLGAVVLSLAGVCPNVDFSDVGGCERPAAAFDRTFKRFLSCGRQRGNNSSSGLCTDINYFLV